MKANELRIGNFISDSDEGFAAMLSSFMGTLNTPHCEVLSLGREGCEVEYLECEDKVGCAIPYLEVEPILLTEDWLVKFGFKNMDKYTFVNKSIFIYHRKRGFIYGSRKRDINLQYVHQLQNLYFALTGEELTIKD